MTQTLLPLQKVAEKNAWVGRMKPAFTTFFRVGQTFTTDTMHEVFEEPANRNYWGALIAHLKDEGRIREAGRVTSKRPEANGLKITQWEVVK